MNSLFIALTLFALFSVTFAVTFPFSCPFDIKAQCVGGNKTCTTSACTPSTTQTVTCQFCKSGLYCNGGVCNTDVPPGAACGVSGSTAPCYDTSGKGYTYGCVVTGNSGSGAVCGGGLVFSAGESGCNTNSFNSATGGCDYGQTCNNGKCTVATGNNCTNDGECGPSNYCSASAGGCKPRQGTGSDCSTDTNSCQFNLIAHIPQGSSKCTCTALWSLSQGTACNSPYVCASGFCNQTAASPTCQSAGLSAGKSCTSDANCVPVGVSDYFPQCLCGSSHGASVSKGQCEYLGYSSSDRSTIATIANCEPGVDYGLRPEASHTPSDFVYDEFLFGIYNGGEFPHYYPGTAVDSQCGPTIRKYLVGACGGAASIPQVLSALFALAIAVALLF